MAVESTVLVIERHGEISKEVFSQCGITFYLNVIGDAIITKAIFMQRYFQSQFDCYYRIFCVYVVVGECLNGFW